MKFSIFCFYFFIITCLFLNLVSSKQSFFNKASLALFRVYTNSSLRNNLSLEFKDYVDNQSEDNVDNQSEDNVDNQSEDNDEKEISFIDIIANEIFNKIEKGETPSLICGIDNNKDVNEDCVDGESHNLQNLFIDNIKTSNSPNCIKSIHSYTSLDLVGVVFTEDASLKSIKALLYNVWIKHNEFLWLIQVPKKIKSYKNYNFLDFHYKGTLDKKKKDLSSDKLSPVQIHDISNMLKLNDDQIGYNNNSCFRKQWALWNGLNRHADCDATHFWYETKDLERTSPVVAVVDSGLDISLPQFKTAIWENINEIPNNGIDDDGNGFVDDVNGWNFIEDSNVIRDYDYEYRHGTHCAGVIGSRATEDGTVGISQHAKIMPLPALHDNGFIFPLLEAIDYSIQMKVPISSHSWGYETFENNDDDPLLNFILNKTYKSNQLFVVAAGNDGESLNQKYIYPARLRYPNMITVGSSDVLGYISRFSNYGTPFVDVIAPGTGIWSTFDKDEYKLLSGTSMAAPLVAGIAAELLSIFPNLTALQLKEAIVNSCTQNYLMKKSFSNCNGIVNISNAYKYIQEKFINKNKVN